MINKPHSTRRQFLRQSAVASAGVALPWIIPAHVLGKERVAPSEQVTLGVIGIGPRATYDLKAMLGWPDVRCVAIADVQATRRDAGKRLVDDHYDNSDCVLYRDLRELLDRNEANRLRSRPQRDPWRLA